MRKQFCVGTLAVGLAGTAFGHGGGLNAEGCHTNRKSGEYHCHRGGGAPSRTVNSLAPTTEPKALTRQALKPTPVVPTCYTGPRGGTYTITASGRKNYGGC